jgi:hypothetical protein
MTNTPQTNTEIQIDLDYLKTIKVFFALPCYGGNITESTFRGFLEWAEEANKYGVRWCYDTLTSESLISRGRNTLTAKFLGTEEYKDATHLFFLDVDIGWKPWQLLSMLMRKVDVIGGVYPMKCLPLKWVVNGLEGVMPDENGLQEVSKTGTGFLLIKRDVFEKMKEHPSCKAYKNDIGLPEHYDQHLRTYFDACVREGRYLSEDWTFCSNWRDLGGKIYIDNRIRLHHTGSFTYCIENQDAFMNAVAPMMVDQMVANGDIVRVQKS